MNNAFTCRLLAGRRTRKEEQEKEGASMRRKRVTRTKRILKREKDAQREWYAFFFPSFPFPLSP
jgi:hypothetical protein